MSSGGSRLFVVVADAEDVDGERDVKRPGRDALEGG